MIKKVLIFALAGMQYLSAIDCYQSHDPEGDRLFFYTGCRVVGDVEFLYWKASANATDYVLQPKRDVSNPSCAVGDYIHAEYEYDPGFRVGLRYSNGPRYWEISALYTWLCTREKAEVKDTSFYLTPTYEDPYITGVIERATSDIRLDYNQLDFMAARIFDPNYHLRIRAYSGFTGAWISNTWDVEYIDHMNRGSEFKQKWWYRAFGYRTGGGFDWYWFCNNFYMSGKATVAITVGKYINTSEQTSKSAPDPSEAFRDTRYEDYRLATHFQMVIGPSYHNMGKCYDWEIFAGYELNAWTNLHEVFRCISDNPQTYSKTLINNGLLGLHGLTIRLSVAY